MKRIATLLVGIALLMTSSSALAAGSSTCQAYNPQLCSSVGATTANDGPGTGTSSGTLPFTGLDVVLLAVGGGTLLGAGLVVRRASRRLN